MTCNNSSACAGAETDSVLRERIVRFMRGASIGITPGDERHIPQLTELLPRRTVVYIAHGLSATLNQVVRTALAVQRAGFVASPHIVARRIDDSFTLRKALDDLRAGGVEQILLVAGDTTYAAGQFHDALDILATDLIAKCGIKQIGVACHPEGQRTVGKTMLWNALRTKQEFARRTGIQMHLVSQFSLHANALPDWEGELERQGILLPIHAGIAGPTPLSKLVKFAMLCGVAASLRTATRDSNAGGIATPLATHPDQHVMHMMQLPLATRIVAPHFFTLGATIETARWIKRVLADQFDIDPAGSHFRVES
jgi:methylenetetrahydrofolate reductase (NADPH)